MIDLVRGILGAAEGTDGPARRMGGGRLSALGMDGGKRLKLRLWLYGDDARGAKSMPAVILSWGFVVVKAKECAGDGGYFWVGLLCCRRIPVHVVRKVGRYATIGSCLWCLSKAGLWYVGLCFCLKMWRFLFSSDL